MKLKIGFYKINIENWNVRKIYFVNQILMDFRMILYFNNININIMYNIYNKIIYIMF